MRTPNRLIEELAADSARQERRLRFISTSMGGVQPSKRALLPKALRVEPITSKRRDFSGCRPRLRRSRDCRQTDERRRSAARLRPRRKHSTLTSTKSASSKVYSLCPQFRPLSNVFWLTRRERPPRFRDVRGPRTEPLDRKFVRFRSECKPPGSMEVGRKRMSFDCALSALRRITNHFVWRWVGLDRFGDGGYCGVF